MTREFNGFRIARKLDVEPKDAIVLLLENNSGEHRLAAWTLKDPLAIKLPIPVENQSTASTAVITDLLGQKLPPTFSGNELTLHLTPSPQYVRLPGVDLK